MPCKPELYIFQCREEGSRRLYIGKSVSLHNLDEAGLRGQTGRISDIRTASKIRHAASTISTFSVAG
jgi:hypothetical protein